MRENLLHSSEHQTNFAAARARHCRGGADEVLCGARLRSGGACRQKPLAGHSRCIRHAGPHAARAFRERQRAAFRTGKISAVEFERAEARRAANRLRDRWKKNPWTPGQTIDLGEHEWAFRHESGIASRSMASVPPGVLDWLRWKYRRLQLDRRRDSEWRRVVISELPNRVERAGPPTADNFVEAENGDGPPTTVWRVDPTEKTYSKRRRADKQKMPKRTRRLKALPVRPSSESDTRELAEIVHRHSAALSPLFAKCASAADQLVLATAFRDLVAHPGDSQAHWRWAQTLRSLNLL